jgi:hypothetical protein
MPVSLIYVNRTNCLCRKRVTGSSICTMMENGRCQCSINDGIMYQSTMPFDPIARPPRPSQALIRAFEFAWGKIMSYVASTYRHVRTMPITAEGLGTIVESAPSRLEIDTELVVDRLLRECFTQKSPDGMGRTDIF